MTSPRISLASDPGAVEVLRAARSLLEGSERLGDTPIACVQRVLTVQTAVELVFRLLHDRLRQNDLKNDSAQQAEHEVLEELGKGSGTPERSSFGRLRKLRNAVAHTGVTPTRSDAFSFASSAVRALRSIVRDATGRELSSITTADLVEDETHRRWLQAAYALLHTGTATEGVFYKDWTPESEVGARAAAVGVAQVVWEGSKRLWWPAESPRGLPNLQMRFDALGSGELTRLVQDIGEQVVRLSEDLEHGVTAVAMGLRQGDLVRFLGLPRRSVHAWGDRITVLEERVPLRDPSDQDAGFAIDFVTDWVLRMEAHVAR